MRFFDTNPPGRILNRFSKDIGQVYPLNISLTGIISNTFSFEYRSVDEFLPKSVLDGAQSILTLVGSIVITATVNPYFLIPACVMGVAFMYIRKIYLKTSKNIKRIEGVGM